MEYKTSNRYKVVLLGDTNVGKTSLVERWIKDTFTTNSACTVGIAFGRKDVVVDNETICIQVWDTAGQERYRSIIPSYIRNADVILICTSVLPGGSFITPKSIKYHLDMAKLVDGAKIILVGTKVDSDSLRSYYQHLLIYANINSYDLLYTSSLNNKGVKELFSNIASYCATREPSEVTHVILQNYVGATKNSCCSIL